MTRSRTLDARPRQDVFSSCAEARSVVPQSKDLKRRDYNTGFPIFLSLGRINYVSIHPHTHFDIRYRGRLLQPHSPASDGYTVPHSNPNAHPADGYSDDHTVSYRHTSAHSHA